jgi:membrane-associated protease RseP (regulator of RpoE activity)
MNETQDSRRTIIVLVIVVAVGLLLSLLAGALAGGVAGYFVGRQQGRIAAESVVDEIASQALVPLPREEELLPPIPEGEEKPEAPAWDDLMPHRFFEQGVEGAVVQQVVEDTPADEAGLQPGDIIVTVDGHSVAEVEDLRDLLEEYEPGDRIELGIWSQGEESTLLIRLDEHPEEPERPYLGIFYQMLRMNVEPPSPSD